MYHLLYFLKNLLAQRIASQSATKYLGVVVPSGHPIGLIYLSHNWRFMENLARAPSQVKRSWWFKLLILVQMTGAFPMTRPKKKQASPPLGREHQQLCVGVLWLCGTENSHTVIPKSFGFQADGKLTPATEGVWPPAPNPCGKKSVKGGRCRSWFPPAPTTLMGQKETWCCCCQQSFSVEHQRLWNLLTIVTEETLFVYFFHDIITFGAGHLRRICEFSVDFFLGMAFLHSLAQEKFGSLSP